MPIRALFVRFLLPAGLAAGGLLGLVGGLAMPPAALIAVGVIALMMACLAVGRARDAEQAGRRSAVEEAFLAAALTVAVPLVVAGLDVLGGAVTAGVVTGVAVVGGISVPVVRALRRDRRAGRHARTAAPPPSPVLPAALDPAPVLAPVGMLRTGDLGREWLLSTAALSAWLDPVTRQSIVRRRQDMLDELERRDPVGFARWMAAGPLPDSDPADYVNDSADTDAA